MAALLSKTPGLKRQVKKLYVELNAIVYKKPYTYRISDDRIDGIHTVIPERGKDEVFFGYYDKCCCWGDKVLMHRTSYSSVHLPIAENLSVVLKDLKDGNVKEIGKTRAWNWQQGSRLHWASNNEVLYNVYDNATDSYKAVLLNEATGEIVHTYDKPVQESRPGDFFLAINYQRLWNMRPDYCYRCKPMLTKKELADMDNDGIWRVDWKTGETKMVHTISDVIKVDYREQFDKCDHNVNHVMLSPNGMRFIFIHRNYLGKQRFDRLMLSDFNSLKVVVDEHYVSHCCWIDDNTILGYLMSGGERGFFFINVDTLKVTKCEEMSALKAGDGHPSFNGRFVAFDSYPDKSRMQKLYVYDTEKKVVCPLLELYQSTKYIEETRCDLHPRFSEDGKKIFFDTVYNGQRELCWVSIEKFY